MPTSSLCPHGLKLTDDLLNTICHETGKCEITEGVKKVDLLVGKPYHKNPLDGDKWKLVFLFAISKQLSYQKQAKRGSDPHKSQQ